MARIPQNEQPATLFPYLSVLLCIIGVLFLGVVVVSTGQLSLKAKIAQHQSMWEEYKTLVAQRERAAEAAKRLQALREEQKSNQIELGRLRQEVGNLESVAADAKHRQEQLLKVQAEAARLEVALNEKRRQNAEVTKTRDERQLAVDTAPKPDTVRIVGTAKMADQEQVTNVTKPLFLECRGDNLIIRPEGTIVPGGALAGSNAFQERIARAEKERDQGTILVLLIRTDGVKTFDRAHAILQKRSVRFGYLPIPGQGDIDLSAFK